MSWRLESYQESNTTGFTSSSVICWTGRNIWVSKGSDIYVYGFWDQNSDYEYLTQNYYFDNILNILYEYQIINVGVNIVNIVHCGNQMIVQTTTGIKIYDKETGILSTSLTISIKDKICIANNRIWYIIPNTDMETQDVLYYYDLLTSTTSSPITLSGRPQTQPRFLIDGLSDWLYITARNDHSILRINKVTGNIDGVHLINRHPYLMYITQDKELYVISDEVSPGAISKFEQVTFTSSIISSSLNNVTSFVIDEEQQHAWQTGAKVARTKLSNLTYRYVGGDSSGYNMIIPYSPDKFVISPKFVYDLWNGTTTTQITVRPYIWFIDVTTGKVVCARLNSMIRDNSYEVLGTAIIGVGSQIYYGE